MYFIAQCYIPTFLPSSVRSHIYCVATEITSFPTSSVHSERNWPFCSRQILRRNHTIQEIKKLYNEHFFLSVSGTFIRLYNTYYLFFARRYFDVCPSWILLKYQNLRFNPKIHLCSNAYHGKLRQTTWIWKILLRNFKMNKAIFTRKLGGV